MTSLRRRDAGPPVDGSVGIIVWVAVFALSTGPLSGRIGLLEGLWLLGPLVVVPVGLGLLEPPRGPDHALLLARRLALPSALLVVVSILAAPGAGSAWVSAPWVIVVGIALWGGLRWFAVTPSVRAKVIVPVAGLVALALAAANLIAWRAQLRPMGLSDTTVALAAVHLTFAGFGAAVVADRTRASATHRRSRAVAGIAATAMVATLPVLAVGLLTRSPTIDLVGTLLYSVAVIVVASVMLTSALRRPNGAGTTALLVVSAGSVLFAVVLASQFAIGRASDTYTLSITRMLELHGTVGGLGFVVGGLIAWTLANVRPDRERR